VIVEADDDDFNLPSWHKAFSILTPQRKAVLIALARTADACTVSTPSLLARYRQFNPHTHLLTNYLDWEMWKDVTPVYERRDWERLRVGWFGSFEMREGDLREISGWLRPWLEQHPEVDFAIGGPGTQEAFDFLRVPEAQRVVLPTYPFATGRLPEMLQFDIGLVPLQEIAFNRAKSHLKGMEYGAAGIPFVASPSQSYQDWVARGGGGLLAQRDRDWKRHLDKLVADERYRQQLAERGREVASRNTIQEHVGAVGEGLRGDAGADEVSEKAGTDRSVRLSVIIPTLGRDTLPRLFDSIGETRHEILVIGDEHDRDLSAVKWETMKRCYRYVGLDLGGPSRAGQRLRDEGIKLATGDWLVFNDDSDIFTPGALETDCRALRRAPRAGAASVQGDHALVHAALERQALGRGGGG
jgi:hypothetical protein